MSFPIDGPGHLPINLFSHIHTVQIRHGEVVSDGNGVLTGPIHLKGFELRVKGRICYKKVGLHLDSDTSNFIVAAR